MLFEWIFRILKALAISTLWVYVINKVVLQKSNLLFWIINTIFTSVLIYFDNPEPLIQGAIYMFLGFLISAIVLAISKVTNKENLFRKLLNRCELRYIKTDKEIDFDKKALLIDKKSDIKVFLTMAKRRNAPKSEIIELENRLNSITVSDDEIDKYEYGNATNNIKENINDSIQGEIMFTVSLVVGIVRVLVSWFGI